MQHIKYYMVKKKNSCQISHFRKKNNISQKYKIVQEREERKLRIFLDYYLLKINYLQQY